MAPLIATCSGCLIALLLTALAGTLAHNHRSPGRHAADTQHEGATVGWSPAAELAEVPERPLDPALADAALKAAADASAQEHDLDLLHESGRWFEGQLARIGQAEQHTCEIDLDYVRHLTDGGRAR